MLFSCHSLFVSLIFKQASDPKTVEENFPPLQSHHLLMYGPAIMVEFGRCDGDCCCLIAQSCLTLCDPMDCSTLGLPVHHQLNGHGFEQAPGVDDGQGGLGCCSPWGHKESDTLSDWTTTTFSITATKLYHYSRTIHKQMTWLQWRKVFLNHFRVTGWFEN